MTLQEGQLPMTNTLFTTSSRLSRIQSLYNSTEMQKNQAQRHFKKSLKTRSRVIIEMTASFVSGDHEEVSNFD